MSATSFFHPASPVSLGVFVLIVVVVIAAFLAGAICTARHEQSPAGPRFAKIAFGLVLWLGLLSFIVWRGLLIDAPAPRLMGFFGAINIVSVVAALSPLGRRYAAAIPIAILVGVQAFRLPLELVLHSWVEQGTIPVTMTWNGANWDIVSGLVALVAAPFAGRYRGIAWAANLIGFFLLLNVMRVAILSSPLPFAWGVEPPLELAAHLPYALIAPVCVGGALFGHIVLTRALLRERG